MKASKGIVVKALFNIISVGSLVTLSACAQPVAETPTTTVPPVTPTPITTIPPVTPTPTVTISPVTPTPTGATTTQNFAELAKSAANQGQFQTLTRAVQAAGLTEQLAAQGPNTVFAPTDAAFAALPKGTLDNLLQPANKQQLIRLLAYHVIPGRITSKQLTSGQVKTVEGTPVKITVNPANNTVTVNDARVTQPDIPASNGVVHVVDKVILPPNFPASLKATPTPR
ncbi:fasciclin domain-containing protein [Komarekiella sp. 'clone 1']|uniref:Fasciclin domain-containing protein n=1 Tax=Komarekiella delphini-convector SJRDD-AB1 TaxID=2593771 RepID=A0AA40STU5_9NOST|nr:fasciclin domain-containing protein [Komarekiella delphini-convector]MBD6615154.1 fasciclin domain-containing protein [Komarekiella delphini-convector SJRDD-AB1]